MSDTPKKVIIEKDSEFIVKDLTSPKTINLERLDTWVVKDHTKPRDIIVTACGGGGTYDHRDLQQRDAEDQHPISAITGLQDILDNVPVMSDFAPVALSGEMNDLTTNTVAILYCGTATEVV